MVATAAKRLRRAVGAVLILLVVVPFWKLLNEQGSPIAIEAIRLTDSYALMLVQGTVAVLVLAAVASSVVPTAVIHRSSSRLGMWLASRGGLEFALALAAISGLLTLFISWYIWDTRPVLMDVLAQFVHARYFAEGMLAGPPGMPYEFWVSANTFVTDHGWVSQYPPGHIVALAAGFIVKAVWVVCPLMMAVAVFFTTLTADRLFPDDRIVARIGAILFALSPLLMNLAAAHMSHVTVVALLSVAGYCALRARDDHLAWAAVAGMAVGAAFATRSVSALVIGPVLLGGIWLMGYTERDRPISFAGMRILTSLIGAAPFLIATAAYNAHFFGSPFEFGYTSYLGPNHGLGFHPDPFGNVFGPMEGLAYTSSDLLSLGYLLLRTPISLVLVIGLYFVFAERLNVSTRLVSVWALCLILPLAEYWHHDLLLGPRMLADAAPAWCLLAALAGVGLVRLVPADKVLLAGRVELRAYVGTAFLLSLMFGAGFLLPRDIRDYARSFAPTPAAPEPASPTLVFVHGQWDGRIVARLLATGMRADSVNTALAVNSSCAMHEFARAYAEQGISAAASGPTPLSFSADVTDGSSPTRLPSGVTIRFRPDETLSPSCRTEAHSDRAGGVPLMPLLWQGDLPGIPGAGAMYARDLGPDDNARLIARHPRRRVGVLLRRPSDGATALLPYETAMDILWSAEPADTTGS